MSTVIEGYTIPDVATLHRQRRTNTYLDQISRSQQAYFASWGKPQMETVYQNGHFLRKRKKLGPTDHKGAAFYDRERLKRKLPPITAPTDNYKLVSRDKCGYYVAPPSWLALPESWGEWKPVPPNHFVDEQYDADKHSRKASAEDYTLEPCDVLADVFSVQTGVKCDRTQRTMSWQLTFGDGATFRFVSREAADLALPELLAIRKSQPKSSSAFVSPSRFFFTRARLAEKHNAEYARERAEKGGDE